MPFLQRLPGAATFLLLLCGLLLSGCTSGDRASQYPNRSIELIVPWAAGGGTDRVARFVADGLQRRLGQPLIVVNRTGGSGAVGHSAGSLAAPDGYTLTMGTFELSTMRSMGISTLTWDSFTPVAQLNCDAAAIFVRQDAPWRNLGELFETIRTQPGRIKMSGTSTGGAWDLARSGLLLAAGIGPTNAIWSPAQGSAPALVELLGGHIDVVSCSVPEALAQLEGRQIRLLAVLSPDRLPQFPDYPTAREQGVAYDARAWRGILVPRGTPKPIVERLDSELAQMARSDEFHQFMSKNGFAIEVRDFDRFADYLRAEEAKWRDVIKSAGYESLGRNRDPGPKTVPVAVTALLVVAVIAEAVRSRRVRVSAGSLAADRAVTQRLSGDALLVLAALVTYIAIMPWIGFATATLAFTLAMLWRLGARWWMALAASVVIVGTIHLLFVTLFKIQLP